MSDQDLPSPEQPTAPGDADDHNRDHPGKFSEDDPEPKTTTSPPADDGSREADAGTPDPGDSRASSTDRRERMSDPGGDSDPHPEKDY